MGALDKLKSRMSGPSKTDLPSETNTQDTQPSAPFNSNDSARMALNTSDQNLSVQELAEKYGVNLNKSNNTPQPTQQPMISQGYEDGIFTKLKTIISNPFDALKVALAPEEGAFESLQSLRNYKRAAAAGDKDAQDAFKTTKAFNTLSQFVPAAATADAVVSAIDGDPTAIVTKRLNKIKPVAKGLTKLKLDPKKTSTVLSTGLKIAKKI